jgi:predicted CXXCH cytochrome family protein
MLVLVTVLLCTVLVSAYLFYDVLIRWVAAPKHDHHLRATTANRLTVWWDEPPPDLKDVTMPSGVESNIHPKDYAGPESCKSCHKTNYDSWSKHPHRWMNALAGKDTVNGDFSGLSISYRKGRAKFFRKGDGFFMEMKRDGVQRTYIVTQTIGSRFFQYYVGKLIEGPEPVTHHFYTKDHVLPFGYWLEHKEWGPVVHIGSEQPDDKRVDPFHPPDKGPQYAEYASSCNYCHTTFPLGDMIARSPGQIGRYAPQVLLQWLAKDYLQENHPDAVPGTEISVERGGVEREPIAAWEATKYAKTLGVSCEACHLGGREHVASEGKVPPKFFPSSPHLLLNRGAHPDFGRTHDNINWACGRCHIGHRPEYAGGMSTWNSVEYSDAMRGSCYSQLQCVHCHNPHRSTGPKWALTADQDDALCLKCHDHLKPAAKRMRHTRHLMGSEGARCMNCHMPRINEGLQDLVRTHTIFKPTRADMLEANHPNACNLCHTDKPIDWTLRYLKDWYGKTYNEGRIVQHYPKRGQPAALGWLESENPAVRMAGIGAFMRQANEKSIGPLVTSLDDPMLLNRQFAYRGLQRMLEGLPAKLGYRYYMSREERAAPLAELHAFLGKKKGK